MDKRINKLKQARCTLVSQCTKDGHTCSRAEDAHCGVYAFPEMKWRLGDCPMADKELRTVVEMAAKRVRQGQQKQKKTRK